MPSLTNMKWQRLELTAASISCPSSYDVRKPKQAHAERPQRGSHDPDWCLQLCIDSRTHARVNPRWFYSLALETSVWNTTLCYRESSFCCCFALLFFWDRISLWSPGWLWLHSCLSLPSAAGCTGAHSHIPAKQMMSEESRNERHKLVGAFPQ